MTKPDVNGELSGRDINIGYIQIEGRIKPDRDGHPLIVLKVHLAAPDAAPEKKELLN